MKFDTLTRRLGPLPTFVMAVAATVATGCGTVSGGGFRVSTTVDGVPLDLELGVSATGPNGEARNVTLEGCRDGSCANVHVVLAE